MRYSKRKRARKVERKWLSNQKLWRIVEQPDGYFYEIKLGSMVVDRIKVGGSAESYFKGEGVIGC